MDVKSPINVTLTATGPRASGKTRILRLIAAIAEALELEVTTVRHQDHVLQIKGEL